MLPRFKSLAANTALSLLAVLAAVGATELLLRLVPTLLPPSAQLRVHWMEATAPVTRGDPEVGFLYPANYEAEAGSGEATFRYSTDEHGFRNPSPWPSRAEVVAVGDSYVFGYGVGDESTWTYLLAGDLPHSRIINLGLSGMAPEQYLRAYDRFGAALRPKLLLFGLFPGNDLQDQGEFDRWLDAGSPGNFGTWKFAHGETPGRFQTLVQHTYVYWLLRETIGRLEWSRAQPVTFADGSRIRFVPSMLQRAAQMATPDNATFRRVLEIIEEARARARERGTEFLVILFPTKEEVYLPLRGDTIPPLMSRFTSALQERGIACLDLTIPLRDEARLGRRLFFEVDGHPVPAGHRVIANALLAHLQQNAGAYDLDDWR